MIKSVTHNRNQGDKKVTYSDLETKSRAENEALKFTPKEL